MSCDRDICATNEYNGIGCDECCVSYDTAVRREQDAYDSGFGKAIEDAIEVISRSLAFAEDLENTGDLKDLDSMLGGYRGGMLAAIKAIHKGILSLKAGGEQE